MIAAASVDWTQILLAVVAIVPGTTAVVLTYLVRRDVKTPSGDTLGAVAEKTLELSSVGLAMTTQMHKKMRDDTPIPPPLRRDG